MKKKLLVGTIGSERWRTTCTINDSDDQVVPGFSRLFLNNDLEGVQITTFAVGALDLAPGEQLQLTEQSAIWEGPPGLVGDAYGDQNGAITCAGCNSIAFQGIRFRLTAPSASAPSLQFGNVTWAYLEGCYIESGLYMFNVPLGATLYATVIEGFLYCDTPPTFAQNSYLEISTFYFLIGAANNFFACTFDGSVPIENGTFYMNPATATELIGPLVNPSWGFDKCLIRNSAAGGVAALHCTGGRYDLRDVRIQGTIGGDAILVEGGPNFVRLDHVTGDSNGGASDVGVRANDGSQVQVTSIATTTLTGGVAGNDVQSGSRAVKTWTDVAAGTEYDLPPNAVSINVATGTRIFERA